MGTVIANEYNLLETPQEAYTAGVSPVLGVREVVLATLAYADLFDYPLTGEEVSRFQIGTKYPQGDIDSALHSLMDAGAVAYSADYYALDGHEGMFVERQVREQLSAAIWKQALYRARGIVRTPFVRMIAVTGALSMNNVSGKRDIDLLVVTEPGRVWIARRLLVLQVRVARLTGDDLCPNYILASNHLELEQRDLFTAHELAQMVPLCGFELYQEMLVRNSWAAHFLPAVSMKRYPQGRLTKFDSPPHLIERILRLRIFDAWEGWELRRLQRKLSPLIGKAAEVVCAPEQCKGHTGLHRSSVLARLGAKLEQLGLGSIFARFLEEGPL